jgi:hypothetical protein
MHKLVRWGLAILTATSLSILAIPAAAHDSTTLIPGQTCSGESTTATYNSGVHFYQSTVNVCLGVPNIGSTYITVEGVVRYHCYIDGNPADRCRWTSTVETQWRIEGDNVWYVHSSVGWAKPGSSPGYIQDSGREWAGHLDDNDLMRVRGKGEAGTVRFLLVSGGNIIRNMSSVYGVDWEGYN